MPAPHMLRRKLPVKEILLSLRDTLNYEVRRFLMRKQQLLSVIVAWFSNMRISLSALHKMSCVHTQKER